MFFTFIFVNCFCYVWFFFFSFSRHKQLCLIHLYIKECIHLEVLEVWLKYIFFSCVVCFLFFFGLVFVFAYKLLFIILLSCKFFDWILRKTFFIQCWYTHPITFFFYWIVKQSSIWSRVLQHKLWKYNHLHDC